MRSAGLFTCGGISPPGGEFSGTECRRTSAGIVRPPVTQLFIERLPAARRREQRLLNSSSPIAQEWGGRTCRSGPLNLLPSFRSGHDDRKGDVVRKNIE